MTQRNIRREGGEEKKGESKGAWRSQDARNRLNENQERAVADAIARVTGGIKDENQPLTREEIEKRAYEALERIKNPEGGLDEKTYNALVDGIIIGLFTGEEVQALLDKRFEQYKKLKEQRNMRTGRMHD